MPKLTLTAAMCQAFDEELQRDDRVCLFGEDVGEFGGVFGTARGLQKKYGKRRVFDTPLSEAAIIGAAVGAAMSGLRPVAEIMYVDFITVGMDPLVNQAAKLRYMSGGQLTLPLVIFTQCGGGTSEAAQHSQSLEAWFVHTPGLKVVMPATVYDAKGLLKASIRDDNPVIFIWHKLLYNLEEEVPDGPWLVPLGQAAVRRPGTDLTVVATSLMVHRAMAAAEKLAGEMSIEVVDPRTLVPLDVDAILASVAKTGRLLVVHEAPVSGGIGGEIVRQVAEKAFDRLIAPPVVLGGANLPMPFTQVLETACMPQQEDIVRAARKIVTCKKQSHWTEKEKARLLDDAVRYIIPHFASNESLARGPKIFVRGEGCYVWDLDGKKYFDSFATLLTTICGHNRPEVTRAVTEQMETLEFFPNYVDTFTVPLVELARKLAQIMPGELSVSFFVNSGSEANETALKMARQYHVERGERHRFKFIGRRDSYHATTLGGSSVTGLTWFREYFEPLLPGCIFAPAARDYERPQGMTSADYGKQCLEELERLIVFEDPRTIAAMIMDPLPGSNTGYPLPPEGYLEGVRRMCDRHGMLLIFDEVQTGFGKTGKWFFSEHYGVVPDIMTIGKGFTGGFIPLGAAVTTPKIADMFRKRPGSELRSGSTYGGHTVACAATLANIAIIERENLVEHAAEMGAYLQVKLRALAAKHAMVGQVRGIGLLWAILLAADRATGKPLDPELGVGTWIQKWCYENGMILRNNGEILVLAPSLIVTQEEIDMVVDLMDRALAAATLEFKL